MKTVKMVLEIVIEDETPIEEGLERVLRELADDIEELEKEEGVVSATGTITVERGDHEPAT